MHWDNGDGQPDLPIVRRKPIQSLEEVLQGAAVEYRYFLDGGNGKFPAYMDSRAILHVGGHDAMDGKPFVFGPWVLRVVDVGYSCIVTRRYRPDLRAWYWFKRMMGSFVYRVVMTWRIWTGRY